MLGDNAERSKNPLKKAMRRRNAKTVQFCDPTYYEASDIDYSTEEEDQDQEGVDDVDGDAESNEVQQDGPDDQDEITAVEPLRPKAQGANGSSDTVEKVGNAAEPIEGRVRSSSDDTTASKEEMGDRASEHRLFIIPHPL